LLYNFGTYILKTQKIISTFLASSASIESTASSQITVLNVQQTQQPQKDPSVSTIPPQNGTPQSTRRASSSTNTKPTDPDQTKKVNGDTTAKPNLDSDKNPDQKRKSPPEAKTPTKTVTNGQLKLSNSPRTATKTANPRSVEVKSLAKASPITVRSVKMATNKVANGQSTTLQRKASPKAQPVQRTLATR
jgi:hypothetical protein